MMQMPRSDFEDRAFSNREIPTARINPHRQRMIEDMTIRNLSPGRHNNRIRPEWLRR